MRRTLEVDRGWGDVCIDVWIFAVDVYVAPKPLLSLEM